MLSADASSGDTILLLKDDPFKMGWQVGDKIGVAATSRDGQTQGLGATSLGKVSNEKLKFSPGMISAVILFFSFRNQSKAKITLLLVMNLYLSE